MRGWSRAVTLLYARALRRLWPIPNGLALAVLCAALPLNSCVSVEAEIDSLFKRPEASAAAPALDALAPGLGTKPPAPTPADTGDARAEPALHDPGYMSVAPDEEAAPEIDPVASRVAEEAEQRLMHIVDRGGMRRLFDEPKVGDARRAPAYFVQIGSHQQPQSAAVQLAAARDRHGDLLAGYEVVVRSVHLGARGRYYRAQIGPFGSVADARSLCRTLRGMREDCFAIAEATATVTARSETPVRLLVQQADALPLYTAPGLPGVPD